MPLVSTVFTECVRAIRDGDLIERASKTDKEFPFQNWFRARLAAIGEEVTEPGRNIYPDFQLVRHTEGYEIKGLAYPGRTASYDLRTNQMGTTPVPNPTAGREHVFNAYRVDGDPIEPLTLTEPTPEG